MKDLVDACQQLDLRKTGQTANVEALIQRDFPGRFGIPFDRAVMSRNAASALPRPIKGLLDELVQHLVDLDYLPFAFYDDYHQNVFDILPPVFSQKISDATKTYFAEDEALEEAGFSVNAINWDNLFTANDILTIVVQRLNLLTSLDGEFIIDSPLKINTQNLFSRVLHYRLNAFGLFIKNDKISAPISSQSIIQTLKINVLLGRKKRKEIDFTVQEISPEQFALTGDVHLLFREFAKHHNKKLLVYKCPQQGVETKAAYEQTIVFKGKFIFGKNEKQFKRRVKRNNLDINQVRQQIKGRGKEFTGANIFGIHLLQLKLWMFGFYYGRIDGKYRDLSHVAFLDFLEQEGTRKQEKYLLPLEDGYWAVNLPQMANLLKKYDNKIKTAEEHEEELIGNIPEESEEEILGMNKGGHEPAEIAGFIAQGQCKQRRIYHGIKSIIASALGGIKRIKKWLKKQIKKVAGAVVSFFKNISKRIREGILIFYRAMRRFTVFVLRKPVISPENYRHIPDDSPFILTRFDLDHDATIIKGKGLSPALMEQHGRMVHNLTFGLTVFLEIAGAAIYLIASLRPPFGWLRLGVRIGRLVADLLKLKIKLPRVPGMKMLGV
ncbi:MAG TPA: hypothetical protein ENJ95_02125 [Bacteroidetes bacterium]|nr:hypothetical protein [Bacteroidota bacterium]